MLVLFITEKYLIAENKNFGLTNSMYNLIGSWKCSELGDYKHLFISQDKGDLWTPKSIDYALLNEQYDIAVISPYFMQNCNPETVNKLKNKLVFCWWDSVLNVKQDNKVPRLCRWWDYGEKGAISLLFDQGCGEIHKNCYGVITPQDETIFNPENNNEITDVSFVGECKTKDRQKIIKMIKKEKFNFFAGGGRGPKSDNIPLNNYAEIHKRSKIGLNFQFNNGQPQRKGRPFELASCGKFMLSNNPHMLNGFFEDGIDYVSFNDNDLIDKIKYFLEHKQERDQYAKKMFDKYKKYHAPEPFWYNILKLTKILKRNILFL